MLTQEQAVEIRVLRRHGWSIRAIARETGLSRVTVRRYLQDPQSAARYGPREPRPTKLEPYIEYVRARVEAARPGWIPAVVLLRSIKRAASGAGVEQIQPRR